MRDSMQCDPIQGQGHEPFKDGNPAVFTSYLLCHLLWELATDHGFLIFGLVFVSRDFEIVRNVSCEDSTVSPCTGLIFIIIIIIIINQPSFMTQVNQKNDGLKYRMLCC